MWSTGSIAKKALILVPLCLATNIVLIAIDSYSGFSYQRNNRRNPLPVDSQAVQPGLDLPSTLKILDRHGLFGLRRNQSRTDQ